jgi:hypothetical protein
VELIVAAVAFEGVGDAVAREDIVVAGAPE